MADIIVTDPATGKRFRAVGPAGASQQDAQRAYEQQNPAPAVTRASTGGGGAETQPSGPSTAGTVAAGLAHGPFSAVEGITQLGNRAGVENLGERMVLNPLNPLTPLARMAGFGPAEMHRRLGQLGEYANQTTAGQWADLAGSILPALIPIAGEAQAPVLASKVAQFLSRYPRAAGFVERAIPALKGMLTGGTSAALQPVPEDDRFWQAKMTQFGLGAALPGFGSMLTTGIGSKLAPKVSSWLPSLAIAKYGHEMAGWPGETMVIPAALMAKQIEEGITHRLFSPQVGSWLENAAQTQRGVGAAAGQAIGRGLGDKMSSEDFNDDDSSAKKAKD